MLAAAVVHSDSGGASGGLGWVIAIGVILLIIALLSTTLRGVGERLPSFLTSMPGASSDNSLSFGTVILGSLVIAVLVVLVLKN